MKTTKRFTNFKIFTPYSFEKFLNMNSTLVIFLLLELNSTQS